MATDQKFSMTQNPASEVKKKQLAILPRVINGSIAGIVGVTCVFPIDLVKTRLQNQTIGPSGERMYTSMYDCAKKTFRNEGFFGMYRGSGVNLLLITPEKAIKLVGNDFFRHHLKKPGGGLTLGRECLAGGGAGMCQIIVTTPMELLKIQLQDAGRKTGPAGGASTASNTPGKRGYCTKPPVVKKLSATSIALQLVRERGVFGLYKGMGATFLRDVTFSAIYFPMFAHLNSVIKRDDGTAPFFVTLVAGCIAGGVASLSVNPFDVVKTRLQTIEKGKGDLQYRGIVDCFVTTLRNEGPLAFFKGGACRMMVIAPLFGIAQTVYYLGVAEWMLGMKSITMVK